MGNRRSPGVEGASPDAMVAGRGAFDHEHDHAEDAPRRLQRPAIQYLPNICVAASNASNASRSQPSGQLPSLVLLQ